ncbi:hypothetical protein, partial [Rhodobaculum claviforme]|uniref:hypothetical protein n=1 Tax=Rhodobaculum claviforme TaxID=1549854 RepID=UPI001A92B541
DSRARSGAGGMAGLDALGRDHADPAPDRARLSARGQANIAAHYAADLAFLDGLDRAGLPGG